jgi:SecD/SecF fusion protein
LDANLTTFITAAILYWVASEEIKGFAIVLMLGIGSSMFTALFVTRVIFDFLLFFKPTKRAIRLTFIFSAIVIGLFSFLVYPSLRPLIPLDKSWHHLLMRFFLSIASGLFWGLAFSILAWLLPTLAQRYIKDHLFMLRLIHKPNVNWMRSRAVFFCISGLLIAACLVAFFTRDDVKNNKYDIEFTGGTSVQINLKEPLARQVVEDRIRQIGTDLNNPALAAANVYSIGKSGRQYEINTTETNKITVTAAFDQPARQTTDELTSAIKETQEKIGGELSNLLVTQDTNNTAEFIITTSQMNQSLVTDVLRAAFPDASISEPHVERTVNNAILSAFADELEIQQNLRPRITSEERITEALIDSYPELVDFLSGVKIECEIERAATLEEIDQRLKDLQFKPDMQNLERYQYQILDSNLTASEPNQPINSFVYISVEPEAGFREFSQDEWTRFVENEKTKVAIRPFSR